MARQHAADFSTRAQRIDIEEPARSRLPDADYADAFRTAAATHHSAEQWARRVLESGSPRARRLFALTVWQGALGLRLGPAHSTDQVAGWAITENEEGIIVLRADSWLLSARMVFDTAASQATWTTLLSYQAKPARGVWGVLGIGHRRIAPNLLTAAAQSLARRPGCNAR